MLVSLVSLLALGASSLAHPLLEERTGSNGCNADNVLRLLRATQRLDDSIAFCSQFLDLPVITQSVPVPAATHSVTITEFRTTTVTETFLATQTKVTFEKLKKRCTGTTSKSISTPGFILSTTIDPSRLSSACGCLTIPLSTLTVPATDLAGTVTTSFSQTETETVTEFVLETTTTTITAPSLILPSATPVSGCCGLPDEPAGFDVDDAYYRVELPIEVEVYGFKSNLVFLSINGLIWLNENSNGNYWYYFTDGDANGADLPLGPDELPDVAILPFWSDLFVNGGAVQGIWYEVSGSSVTFEYVVSAYGNTANDYHFTVTLSGSNKVTIKYYSVLDSASGTVAIQKKSSNDAIVFSRYGSNVVSGLTLEFDTVAGTVSTV